MRHVLRAGAQLEDGQKRACRDRWPARERRTCLAQRSRVRSSSNCRCGRWRWKKKRSCRVCAWTPARVRKAGDSGLTIALRPVGLRKDPALQPGQRAPWRSAARGFSDETRACCDGHVNVERQAGPRNVWMRSAWPCLPSPKSRMNLSIGHAEVLALLVGTGVPLGVDSLGCSAAAFDLAPRAYWCWRWPSSRRGSGGEPTGGAIVWGSWREQTVERGALGSSS